MRPMPPIILHVGFARDIPFVLTLGGVVSTDPVDIGSSQPGNLRVQLADPRTLRVTGLNISTANAVVKAYPGTPNEVSFPLEFSVLASPPPTPVVSFGTPGPEFPTL